MRIIGSGTFAQVYQDDKFAVKKTRLECRLWHTLPHHPNLLRLDKVHKNGSHFYYYSRHYQNGDLHQLMSQIGRLPEQASLWMTCGIAKGLQAMHANGYSHRDVKLENVLLGDRFEPILCDFDFCTKTDNGENGVVGRRCGSIPYCAPEVLTKQQPQDPRQADCWSLGVCLYAMAVGRLPFDGKTNAENDDKHIINRIMRNQYNIPISMTGTMSASIINGLLQTDPAKRLTIEQVVNILQDNKHDLDHDSVIKQIKRLQGPVGFDMSPSPPRLLYMHGNISASEMVLFSDDLEDPHNYYDGNRWCKFSRLPHR